MARQNLRTNFRVEVYPREASDLGFASISRLTRSEAETERACEQIADEIRRHVDGLPSRWNSPNRGVNITWDNEPVCSHCGSPWTEKSDTYNGGCCAKDEDANPEFAGQALTGFIAGGSGYFDTDMASQMYRIADAMLAARSSK